jgi:hypothetical protein
MPIYTDDLHNRKGLPQPLLRAQVPDYFGAHCKTGNFRKITVPILGAIYVHKRIAQGFANVFADIERAGKGDLIDMANYGGTYNCRQVRSGGAWSPHAWAIGMDLNVNHHGKNGRDVKLAATNYLCKRDAIAPSLAELAPFFYRWGFSWGGIWTSTCDPMHFEATELTVQLLEGGARVANQGLWEARMKKLGPVMAAEPTGVPTAPKAVKLVELISGRELGEVTQEIAKRIVEGTLTVAPNGDHRADQGKLYLAKRS